MDNRRLEELIHKFGKIFSTKRLRVTLYMVAVLWVAVVTQIAVNHIFQKDAQITEAFIKSETLEMQSGLEIVAEYKADFLSGKDKKDIINKIADSIGLKVDKEISVLEEEGRSEYYFYKQAQQAATEIKVISIEQEDNETVVMKHYIIIRMTILQGIQSIDQYKNILESTLTKIGVSNKQVTLKYEGSKEGDLTAAQKHEIASNLIKDLQGKIALEYDEGDLYTVYAYTGMLDEYVTSMGNKINVQVVITYNESTNKTKVILATPVDNDSW